MEDTRTFIITFKIPDSDFAEDKFFDLLREQFGTTVKGSIRGDDTTVMYENDPIYRDMVKKDSQSKKITKAYFQDNKHKYN